MAMTLELTPPSHGAPDAPLAGLSVVELAGELTGYAGRLLHDLGADVTLVGMVDDTPESRFLHHGKRVTADAADLLPTADVVLYTGGADGIPAPPVGPRTIAVALTPFGLDGPCRRLRVHRSDPARGGRPPLARRIPRRSARSRRTATRARSPSSIYGVVATLLALVERDASGEGCTVEVSAQEVMTQALETALPDYELTGRVRTRLGSEPREAGPASTLRRRLRQHGRRPARHGRGVDAAARVARRGGRRRARTSSGRRLGASSSSASGPSRVARFAEIFGRSPSTRTKQELYAEAQRRSIALAPVNTPADVLADPQLVARAFFARTRTASATRRSALSLLPARAGRRRGGRAARR